MWLFKTNKKTGELSWQKISPSAFKRDIKPLECWDGTYEGNVYIYRVYPPERPFSAYTYNFELVYHFDSLEEAAIITGYSKRRIQLALKSRDLLKYYWRYDDEPKITEVEKRERALLHKSLKTLYGNG